jgi:RNA polymerase sigma factor (sigma-70 family)
MSFPSPIWTTLRWIKRDPERVMEAVVGRYRRPVQAFLRRKGLDPEDAEDFTQEVLLRVCSDAFLSKVDPSKGRFRALLLAVTLHVLSSFKRRERAALRGRLRATSLEGFDPAVEPPESPDFDRLWAANLTFQAMERLRGDRFVEAFRLQLQGKTYKAIGTEMGLSETSVTNHIHRGKKRLRREIERLVSEYCGDNGPEELASLLKYL